MIAETIKYFVDCSGELVELPSRGVCPRCAGRHKVRTIRYSQTPGRHACNALCMTAKGPNCECSCGGKNHGAGFILSGDLFDAA